MAERTLVAFFGGKKGSGGIFLALWGRFDAKKGLWGHFSGSVGAFWWYKGSVGAFFWLFGGVLMVKRALGLFFMKAPML